MDAFIADLQMSALSDVRQYEHLDGDALAKLYNDSIAGLLDKQIPVSTPSHVSSKTVHHVV